MQPMYGHDEPIPVVQPRNLQTAESYNRMADLTKVLDSGTIRAASKQR